jgi:hypothetical protein
MAPTVEPNCSLKNLGWSPNPSPHRRRWIPHPRATRARPISLYPETRWNLYHEKLMNLYHEKLKNLYHEKLTNMYRAIDYVRGSANWILTSILLSVCGIDLCDCPASILGWCGGRRLRVPDIRDRGRARLISLYHDTFTNLYHETLMNSTCKFVPRDTDKAKCRDLRWLLGVAEDCEYRGYSK